MNFLKNTFLLTVAAVSIIFTGCKTVYVPVKETEYVHVHDSVAVHDTTVQFQLQKEYIERYATDTLRLETTYSEFTAFHDTLSRKLAGIAKNKDKTVLFATQWKERIVVRDSIQRLEVPVPVEVEKRVPYVPFFWKLFSVIGILATAVVTVLILRKFHVL